MIVPIYGAAADLARCLRSVAAHTDLTRHGLILVVDGPQDDAVESAIAAHRESATVVRNDARRGFVASVNRGMRQSVRDVVLLNSDTVVTSRWLEKLIDAALSADRVATVTPLSNHATLCSVPRAFEENFLPAGLDADGFAALVERVSTRTYVRIPTGVGVCLYIRRAALDDVGFFDEIRFGLGYGEENDFCMRAGERGWVHLADDATFIEHAGHRSFGASRTELQRTAARRLADRHPKYMRAIARFMRDDPLGPVRARIVEALRGSPPKGAKVVHVVHGWPPFQHAGTELYASWLVQRQLRTRDVSVFARLDDPSRAQGEAVELFDRGARVRLVTNNFTQRDPLARNAIRDRTFERAFAKFLAEEKPALVHIHHLAGHAFSLAGVARRLGIPIVQQLQDWWPLCARVNLCDAWSRRCSGPSLAKCSRCAPLTRIAPAPLWNRALHLLRRRAAQRALGAADAYVMGSNAIRDDYVRAGLLAKGKQAYVIPYGIEVPARNVPRGAQSRPVRFGFVGSNLPHKGLAVAVEAFRGVDPALAVLTTHSGFVEEEKDGVFASMDVLLVPSIGLESFCLTAREAMARGVPVIATRDGALTEIEGAELFPNGDAEALRELVLRVARAPELLAEWTRRIPPPKSVDTHAEEIERVYDSVLARR